MPVILPGGGGSSSIFIPYIMDFTVQIPNFPEWAIPMTKVIPRCYIDDGYDISNISFIVQCQHVWIVSQNQDKLGNSLNPTVLLQVRIYASATDLSQSPNVIIPTYIDVDLVFFNERTYTEINTNKS